MMVGPEVEKDSAGPPRVSHVHRRRPLDGPFFTIVLRKAYGLGALAMTAGSSQASFFIVA
jgi:acetyl-CoA carboxylase carboxyltransferase component